MWHIHEVVNTVLVDGACARALFDAQEYEGEVWDSVDEVTFKNTLYFNSDHMEHMDYVWRWWAIDALCAHKVKGDICFLSEDGDNAGDKWGYRFDGEGGVELLKGVIAWVPDDKGTAEFRESIEQDRERARQAADDDEEEVDSPETDPEDEAENIARIVEARAARDAVAEWLNSVSLVFYEDGTTIDKVVEGFMVHSRSLDSTSGVGGSIVLLDPDKQVLGGIHYYGNEFSIEYCTLDADGKVLTNEDIDLEEGYASEAGFLEALRDALADH